MPVKEAPAPYTYATPSASPPPSPPPLADCALCQRRRYRLVLDGAEASGTVRAVPCACVGACPACDGSGWLPLEQDGLRYSAPCPCRKRTRRLACFNEAKIPALYLERLTGPAHAAPSGYTFSPTQKAAFKRVEAWALGYEPGCRGLILWGPIGTGKTALLTRALRYLTIDRGVRSLFQEWTLLLKDEKKSWDGESESPWKNVDFAEVLAVDELGRQASTTWQQGQIENLIQARYQGRKPTLWATNLNPKELRGEVEARLYDRLVERNDFVEVSGQSLRPHLAGERP
jgi:DNA replication protein DnaC